MPGEEQQTTLRNDLFNHQQYLLDESRAKEKQRCISPKVNSSNVDITM